MQDAAPILRRGGGTVQVLVYLYGDTPAREFFPMRLRAVREYWTQRDLARSSINNYAVALRSVFKWAASY